MEAELGSDNEDHDNIRKEVHSGSEEFTDEEAIRKEIADMIDSNEDLSDGLEYLQQKFIKDQIKDEKRMMKQVIRNAFKRSTRQFEDDQFMEEQRLQMEKRRQEAIKAMEAREEAIKKLYQN